MATILLVDDDKNHLNAMWRAFWLDGQHEVERFTSPGEALERAKEQPFDAVVADYRMPEMDGVRFLQAFRELQPQACRIMISGNADMGLFRNAMKEARVHHLLEKPCDGFQLLSAVQEGLEQVSLSRENERLRGELAALQQKFDKLSRRLSAAPELET
jgi:DNA-binding NtrC family response regulator